MQSANNNNPKRRKRTRNSTMTTRAALSLKTRTSPAIMLYHTSPTIPPIITKTRRARRTRRRTRSTRRRKSVEEMRMRDPLMRMIWTSSTIKGANSPVSRRRKNPSETAQRKTNERSMTT